MDNNKETKNTVKLAESQNDIKKDIESEIKDVIEGLRPFLNMEGGDVEFVKYDEKEKCVYVKLTGACAMCMAQDDTLEYGLLEAIKDKVPTVENIVNTPI